MSKVKKLLVGIIVMIFCDVLVQKKFSGKSINSIGNTKNTLLATGIIVSIGLAIHNFPEGMVIGASYVNSDSTTVFSGAGFFIAIVIGLHNIPEGMAVSVPLISGGTNKAKAVLLAALSGFPTVIGALFGYLIGSIDPIVLSMSLGFASGAMLYVVFGELLPESILVWKCELLGK